MVLREEVAKYKTAIATKRIKSISLTWDVADVARTVRCWSFHHSGDENNSELITIKRACVAFLDTPLQLQR